MVQCRYARLCCEIGNKKLWICKWTTAVEEKRVILQFIVTVVYFRYGVVLQVAVILENDKVVNRKWVGLKRGAGRGCRATSVPCKIS